MCIRDRYLPYSETEIATIVDDDNNDNKYLPCEVNGVCSSCLLYTSRCV